MPSNELFLKLVQHLASKQERNASTNSSCTLCIADENTKDQLHNLKHVCGDIYVLSNRFDIYQQSLELGFHSVFNDFVFPDLPKQQFDNVVYSVSKERAVCHYIFNHLPQLLTPTGTLVIGGKKNEGIKNYVTQLKKKLPLTGELKKDKDDYTAKLHYCNTSSPTSATEQPFDDKNYSDLRSSAKLAPLNLEAFNPVTKPGLYGWNKIDKGSELLIEQISSDTTSTDHKQRTESLLDLGCGFGYLTIMSMIHNLFPNLRSVVLTDNNAAAIQAANKNMQLLQHNILSSNTNEKLSYKVIADNCAQTIHERFDTVICNPPFHQGFSTNKDLTHLFVNSALQHLTPQGIAYFVVNTFIGIEKLVDQSEYDFSTLTNNAQFKVMKVNKRMKN